MVLTVNKSELTWAAGLYDGEGHTGCHKSGKTQPNTKSIVMQVCMVDPDVVARFHKAVGGLGCFKKDKPSRSMNRQTYTWTARSHMVVQQVAILLWPFLSTPKKTQITTVLTTFIKNVRRVGTAHVKNIYGQQWDGEK